MKLVLCIINDRDKASLCNALVESNFEFTLINSSGGFLNKNNITLMLGVSEERLLELESLIKEHCKPREEMVSTPSFGSTPAEMLIQSSMSVRIGGATFFVLPLDKFEHF